MASKKDSKQAKSKAPNSSGEIEQGGKITSAAELKTHLQTILDKMKEESVAPVYVASAMNYVFNLPHVAQYLDNENREIARDIWLRVKQSGFQVKNPTMLFDEIDGVSS